MSGVTTGGASVAAGRLAPRLTALRGARIGLLSTGKRNCDALLDEIGALLVERCGALPVRRWTKPSVYRFSPLHRLDGIKQGCDAVVAGVGDCGHGSACTFHDVFWLEEEGVPVACIDTPGRMHRVRRDGDVFVVDYLTLKYLVRDLARLPEDERPATRNRFFERQGIFRALRLAGAQAGNRVRVLDREIVLDELPPPPRNWLPRTEGIPDYPYIVTAGIGRLDADGVRARARELLPRVVAALVAR